MPGEERLLVVVDGEGGAPVGIAGLADRTGIEQIAISASKLHRELLRLGGEIVFRLETGLRVVAGGEPNLAMGVAEECDGGRRGPERRRRIVEREKILVFIAGRTVDAAHGRVLRGHRAHSQTAQPLPVVVLKNALRPLDRHLRILAKIEHRKTPACPVVIAAHHEVPKPLHPIDHFIGTGAVTDYIAQVPDHVMGRRRSQDGFESFEVGMDVGEDERAHGDLASPIQPVADACTMPCPAAYSAARASCWPEKSPAYLVMPTIVNTLVKCGESP